MAYGWSWVDGLRRHRAKLTGAGGKEVRSRRGMGREKARVPTVRKKTRLENSGLGSKMMTDPGISRAEGKLCGFVATQGERLFSRPSGPQQSQNGDSYRPHCSPHPLGHRF